MNGLRGLSQVCFWFAVGICLTVATRESCGAPLSVVVTIKPIHSLAAAILDGVAKPKLLLEGAASPHSYALRPSDAEALSTADAVIRVSEHLEVFLGRAVGTLPSGARVIDLDQAPGLKLLPVRKGIFSSSSDDGEKQAHSHEEGEFDVHFWLDPINGIALADYLAQSFSLIDGDHASQYRANAGHLKNKLAILDQELRTRLAGLSQRPFIVFHDVTQYLERRYQLRGEGAVTLSPEQMSGAQRLAQIRARILEKKAVCVFSEPQFRPKLIERLVEGTGTRQGVVDEIGAAIPAGPEEYFELLRFDADSLSTCLKP